jgi:hypothetical protein
VIDVVRPSSFSKDDIAISELPFIPITVMNLLAKTIKLNSNIMSNFERQKDILT